MRLFAIIVGLFGAFTAAGTWAVQPGAADAEPLSIREVAEVLPDGDASQPQGRSLVAVRPPPLRTGHAAAPHVEAQADHAVLAGMVLDEEGNAPEEVILRVLPKGTLDEPLDAAVLEDGSFEEVLAPGEYALEVRAHGYLPQRVDGVVVSAGEEVRGVLLTLSRGLSLRGQVTSEGAPVQDALVVVEGNGFLLWVEALAGDFVVEGLLPGSYEVRAFHPEFGSDERIAHAGADVALELRGRTLEGTVLDGRGVPVADAEVHVRVRLPGADLPARDPVGLLDGAAPLLDQMVCAADHCGGVATLEDGRFSLEVPHSGELVVYARTPEGWAMVRGRADDLRDVVLRLESTEQVRVRITQADGQTRPAWVDVEDRSGVGLALEGGATDERGELTLHLPRGVPLSLAAPYGTKIEPAGSLPANVALTTHERPLRRCKLVVLEPDVSF